MGRQYLMGLGAGRGKGGVGGRGGCNRTPKTTAVLFSACCTDQGRAWHLGERRVTKSILRASASLPEAWQGSPSQRGLFPPLVPSLCPTASPPPPHFPCPGILPSTGRGVGLRHPQRWGHPEQLSLPPLPPPPSPPPALAPARSDPPSLVPPASRERFGPSLHGLSPPLKAAASCIAHPPPIARPGRGGCCRLDGVGGCGCCPWPWAALPCPWPPLPLAAAGGRCEPATSPRTGG